MYTVVESLRNATEEYRDTPFGSQLLLVWICDGIKKLKFYL